MDFTSDNATTVSPEIMDALYKANSGFVPSYGGDDATRGLDSLFSDIFETTVKVFPVLTGTAANALALATLTPPFGAIFCHNDAHINTAECGAPEFFTNGAKLIPVAGDHGKIDPSALAEVAGLRGPGDANTQPKVLSLTQLTESGTAYSLDELRACVDIAKAHGLSVHMDGARFANALVALDCTPGEMTWRSGVDVLSFGATKNGAMAAEAVIYFGDAGVGDFTYRRKRGGHLVSKLRFVSAQLEAYVRDGLWLANARRANALAQKLGQMLGSQPECRLLHPVDGNEVFVRFPAALDARLKQAGFRYHGAPADGGINARLVTAFNTEAGAVDALISTVAGAPQAQL